MTVNEDQIRKLIKDYEGYREEHSDSWSASDIAMARVYGAVIHDLEELLPRKTLADVAGDNLEPYLGTWVECSGRKALVIMVAASRIFVTIPEIREVFWIESSRVYPLDIDRVWGEDGVLVY